MIVLSLVKAGRQRLYTFSCTVKGCYTTRIWNLTVSQTVNLLDLLNLLHQESNLPVEVWGMDYQLELAWHSPQKDRAKIIKFMSS